GQVAAVEGHQVRFEGGRWAPVAGTEFSIPADLVLLAMGFTGPRRSGLIEKMGLALTPRGSVEVDAQFRTSVPKVFAAGDVKRGASLIVWAIAEGRKMAAFVD